MERSKRGEFMAGDFILAEQPQESSEYINSSLQEIISALEIRSFSFEDLCKVLGFFNSDEEFDENEINWEKVELAANKIGSEALWNRLGKPDIEDVYKFKKALGEKIWDKLGMREKLSSKFA